LRVDEPLHAGYGPVGAGDQSGGVCGGDLALLLQHDYFGAEALKVGERVLELVLAQLGARAVELADQPRLILCGVLADTITLPILADG
jgi:hypothetical protein